MADEVAGSDGSTGSKQRWVKASLSRRALLALLIILAISGVSTALSLSELGQIRTQAVDALERVLPSAQQQHHRAVDAASLFAAYHELLHGNDQASSHGHDQAESADRRPAGQGHAAEQQAILREVVRRAASLQALVSPDLVPTLKEVTRLSTRVVELGREELLLGERVHDLVQRGEELVTDLSVLASGIIQDSSEELERGLRLMARGLERSYSMSGFKAEHEQLSQRIQVMSVVRGAANQLIRNLNAGLRALVVAEHYDSKQQLQRAAHHFDLLLSEFGPLLATIEELPGRSAEQGQLRLLIESFAKLNVLFAERRRYIELQAEKDRTTQAVDARLEQVATSLTVAAGNDSLRGIERIVDSSSLTMLIVSLGIATTAIVFFSMVALGRRHVIVPLTQASAALDAMGSGAIAVDLPPMRYRELESIRQSLARFRISTVELAEMNRRLEREILERRQTEAEAIQARRVTLDAIESIADGFMLFDEQERMVLCNTCCRELYPAVGNLLKPGVTQHELLRGMVDKGSYLLSEAHADAWVEERLRDFRALAGTRALALPGGRWIRISEFRTLEGGTVCIHTDITEQRRAEDALIRRTTLVQMLREIALDTNDANSIEEAIQGCLDKVCTYTGFVIGHAYLPPIDGTATELNSANLWYLRDPVAFAPFREITEQNRYAPGQGLPGRVWATGEPVWDDDVRASGESPRRDIARQLGIGSACAFPVLERDRVVAVLEFFADRVLPQDVPLQNAVANLATQLGRITERKRHLVALTKLRQAVEQSPAMIMITDLAGVIEYINSEGCEITGYQASELVGRRPGVLKSGATDSTVYQELWRTITAGGDWRGEFLNRRKDGSLYWSATLISPIRDEHRTITHFLCVAEDITDRKATEQRIRHLAHYDVLTDLPNRAMFQAQARQILAGARRAGKQVAMLMIDLDDFKDVNDSLGHATGDRLLVEVASRLHSCMRECDIVARLGGDEFALILPEIESADAIDTVVKRLIDLIQQPYHIDDIDLYVSASIGIAMHPADGDNTETLLKHADLAMYRAKNRGRGTYNFYLSSMDHDVQRRKTLEAELRQALERGEFRLVYQPQVDLQQRRVSGVEALLRWHHPNRDRISPAEFIPVAEHCGLIVPIGEWVLEEACRQACAWRRDGHGDIAMAVNLSPIQFKHHDLLGMVQAVVARTGMPPGLLYLEITESVVMQESETNLGLIRALRAMGIRIALDDFGTGYSSLSYLTTLPIDKIKIDRTFVVGVATDPVRERVVRTIVDLGTALGKRVSVEGVEDEQQWQVLYRNQVDEIQGFHFSRPVAAPEVERLFTDAVALDRAFRRKSA